MGLEGLEVLGGSGGDRDSGVMIGPSRPVMLQALQAKFCWEMEPLSDPFFLQQ